MYTECNISADAKDFYILQSAEIGSGVETFYSVGTVFLPGAKQPGREVDHSTLSGTEVKKNVSTFLLSRYALSA